MNQNKAPAKLFFASDYMEGAHPLILQRLMETNLLHTVGYGTDEFSESARAKVRKACNAPDADVYFLVGGTQTNATVIGSILRPYQGVIAAETGHVSTHEAGAIEAGGHKVITLPHKNGKLDADTIERCIQGYWDDANHEHMVMPGLVYISQPTEFGTLYSLEELTKISETCHKHDIPLYVDGARLAYGLACKQNDVTLTDLARLCDAFYIGGTKCGALFGEAVVLPRHDFVPHFFTLIKQNRTALCSLKVGLPGSSLRLCFQKCRAVQRQQTPLPKTSLSSTRRSAKTRSMQRTASVRLLSKKGMRSHLSVQQTSSSSPWTTRKRSAWRRSWN